MSIYLSIYQYNLGCVELSYWGNYNGHYLAGYAIDNDGNNVYETYNDLLSAQLSCINHGGGCGGVTASGGSYTLRAGSSFISSTSGEHSYIKPAKPCNSKLTYVNLHI